MPQGLMLDVSLPFEFGSRILGQAWNLPAEAKPCPRNDGRYIASHIGHIDLSLIINATDASVTVRGSQLFHKNGTEIQGLAPVIRELLEDYFSSGIQVPRLPQSILDCLGLKVSIFGNSANLDLTHAPQGCGKFPLKSTILAYSEVFQRVIDKRLERLRKKPEMYEVDQDEGEQEIPFLGLGAAEDIMKNLLGPQFSDL
jgi:hypothetical protein